MPGRSKLSTEEALLRGGVVGFNENWRSVMCENDRSYRRFGCARLVARAFLESRSSRRSPWSPRGSR